MSKVVFKLEDKIRIKAGVKPLHGWGKVKAGDVGVVKFIGAGTMMLVDFPAQKGWTAEMSEMEHIVKQATPAPVAKVAEVVVDKPRRKSPEKVLAYGIIQKDGTLHSIKYDRDEARRAKLRLGGKRDGVTIVVLTAGKEIR